jgi:hypothetical protein
MQEFYIVSTYIALTTIHMIGQLASLGIKRMSLWKDANQNRTNVIRIYLQTMPLATDSKASCAGMCHANMAMKILCMDMNQHNEMYALQHIFFQTYHTTRPQNDEMCAAIRNTPSMTRTTINGIKPTKNDPTSDPPIGASCWTNRPSVVPLVGGVGM